MHSAAQADAAYEFVVSRVSNPRNTVANAPNHAGTRQQTSFSEMGAFLTCAYQVNSPSSRNFPRHLPNKYGRHLHARVDRRADGSTERVPGHAVEPREELA